VRPTLAALALLLAATTASAQTSPDGQSWETPMSAGDRAYQLGRYAEAERFFTTALERARAIAVHFDVDVMDSAEIPLADWPHYDALSFGDAMRCLSVFV